MGEVLELFKLDKTYYRGDMFCHGLIHLFRAGDAQSFIGPGTSVDYQVYGN
jgi:hypothetical protein